jgi:hypothetical protein
VGVAEEAPVLASVPAVAALVECQEVGAREQADLVLAVGRAWRVHQEAFGKAAAVRAPEEVWEPVAPRVVQVGADRAADQVRVPEGPEADPEGAVRVGEPALAAVRLGLALAAERGQAEEARASAAELAGKPREGG